MPEKSEECAICFEPLSKGPGGSLSTAFGHKSGEIWHVFHLGCITKYQRVSGNHTCPTCRANVNPWVEVTLT